MPESDNFGSELLQSHLRHQNALIVEFFQQVLDRTSNMLDALNNLELGELENRLSLVTVAQGVREMHPQMMPTPDFDGE